MRQEWYCYTWLIRTIEVQCEYNIRNQKVTRALNLTHLYCNARLYVVPQSSISKRQHIQNVTARLLTSIKKFDHITPTLKSRHWIRLEKRFNFKVLLLVYRVLHDQAPEYIRDILQERTNVQTFRPIVSSSLAIPQIRLEGFGDHAISMTTPTLMLWQDL